MSVNIKSDNHNKYTDSWENLASAHKKRKYIPYCTSDSCCSYITTARIKQKNGIYSYRTVNKRKPCVEVLNHNKEDNCKHCGNSLIWKEE